eukprot:3526-Heterococcus_DN1.PRE.2
MHSAHRLSVASAVTMVGGVAVLVEALLYPGSSNGRKPGSTALGRAWRGCVCAQMLHITKRVCVCYLATVLWQ